MCLLAHAFSSWGRCERRLRRPISSGWRIGIGFRRLGLRLGWEIEELSSALPQAREGGKGRASYPAECISYHVRNYHGFIRSFKQTAILRMAVLSHTMYHRYVCSDAEGLVSPDLSPF
jgi:hypothetical protein